MKYHANKVSIKSTAVVARSAKSEVTQIELEHDGTPLIYHTAFVTKHHCSCCSELMRYRFESPHFATELNVQDDPDTDFSDWIDYCIEGMIDGMNDMRDVY